MNKKPQFLPVKVVNSGVVEIGAFAQRTRRICSIWYSSFFLSLFGTNYQIINVIDIIENLYVMREESNEKVEFAKDCTNILSV